MSFYNYYLEQNRIKDIQNQLECVKAAICFKSFLMNEISDIPKKHRWLSEKVLKNIQDKYRGQLVEKDVIGVLDEIIARDNTGSLLFWSKSPRKQKIEDLQRNYIKSTHGIDILAGKKHGVCANGDNSFRFVYETFEFKKGLGKKEGLTTKSMDGIIDQNNLTTTSKCWVFQKVTTDDGGSTNSVEEEVIKTISVAIKHQNKFTNSDYYIFLLDGPYWLRRQYKTDTKNRFEKILEMSSEKVIICDSDSIKSELIKRNLIK